MPGELRSQGMTSQLPRRPMRACRHHYAATQNLDMGPQIKRNRFRTIPERFETPLEMLLRIRSS